jgi:hypothetical protein
MSESEEFFRRYAERSGVTVAQLREWGQEVYPCDCGDVICEGFVVENKELHEEYLRVIGEQDA